MQEICALRARLAEAVRENETLQESVATASRDISELATLICTHDHSAQAAFLQSCISSAHSTQLHGGASHQASCEGREGGKRQSVATADIEGGEENSHVGPRAASASSVDIGAAARDLAAMMLLRYRFLEAEKQQATVELEQQLHSALTLVRTGKQELAACYEQVCCCDHPIHHAPALCPKSRPRARSNIMCGLGRWRSWLRSRGERMNMKSWCALG